MAFVVKDRVKETTLTTGTGTITLAGAVTNYQSFSAVGNLNTTYYAITSGTDWEVGVGTYTASGTTLSRDTVLASSAGGGKITLAGTSIVFCDYPAGKSVYLDANDLIATAMLGTGTASSSTVLLGDRTWGTVSVSISGKQQLDLVW